MITEIWHTLFAHWYIYVPLGVIGYPMLGALSAAFHEGTLRRLQGRTWSNLTAKEKLFAYIVYPISSLQTWDIETDTFSFRFESLRPTNEEQWTNLRRFSSGLWPAFFTINVIGWTASIVYILLRYVVCYALIGLILLMAAISAWLLSLVGSPDRTEVAPQPAQPVTPKKDERPVRIVELRTRIETSQQEIAAKQAALEADQHALAQIEAETELGRGDAYRGAATDAAE